MGIPVMIPPLALPGELAVPEAARGMVIFAHGSGSSRFSVRNQAVAAHLRAKGLGTLLIDLLTAAEDEQPDYRFDIELLASRLVQATVWVQEYPLLRAAAEPDNPAYAVVSRGGRPELAASTLGLVRAPTLLVVGSQDGTVLGYNKRALRQLNPQSRLEVIEGATHLFEEPGALEAVARMAGGWFVDHLPG